MHYVVDTTNISHERLHDEVIIINLASGAYYSGLGTAADLWTLLSRGASLAEAASMLAIKYACDQKTVSLDIERSLSFLVERGILQRGDAVPHQNVELMLPELARGAWSPPKFDEYTDMWDLIRLDPIHDVGDAGWPFATPSARV
jgi:Coenzyme PQQ synthesis protein D (PqqD)